MIWGIFIWGKLDNQLRRRQGAYLTPSHVWWVFITLQLKVPSCSAAEQRYPKQVGTTHNKLGQLATSLQNPPQFSIRFGRTLRILLFLSLSASLLPMLNVKFIWLTVLTFLEQWFLNFQLFDVDCSFWCHGVGADMTNWS